MPTVTLFDFLSTEKLWSSVDDAVMGGVSSSRMRFEEGIAVFEGTLSLENNGGFASGRSPNLAQKLEGGDRVRIRVKGDGKKYQLRIRTSESFDGPNYQMTFETKRDEWVEVDLPFSGFVAAYRGREIPNYAPINPVDIANFGFLIADKQEGKFRLEIDWIRVAGGQ